MTTTRKTSIDCRGCRRCRHSCPTGSGCSTSRRRDPRKPGRVRVNVNTAYATRNGIFYADTLHDTAAQSAAWTDWVKRSH